MRFALPRHLRSKTIHPFQDLMPSKQAFLLQQLSSLDMLNPPRKSSGGMSVFV